MERNLDLISVVIPVYDVEQHLRRCLDSVISQIYDHLEIILVDDGSKDNSGKICDEYAKKDSRIKVIHKINNGLSAARNTGIENSHGKYITFVDSDDWMPEYAIKSLHRAIIENNSDISVGVAQRVLSHHSPIAKKNKKMTSKIYNNHDALQDLLYLRDFTTSAWGKLYNSNLFNDIRFPIGRIYEDLGTTYKVFAIANKIVLVDDVTYYYYQGNTGSIMHKSYDASRLSSIDFAEDCLVFVEDKFPDISAAAKYRIFYECLAILENMPLCNSDKKYVYSVIKKYRRDVFMDPDIGTKGRVLCLSSYFGHLCVKLMLRTRKYLRNNNV